jgi:hypothetical protein
MFLTLIMIGPPGELILSRCALLGGILEARLPAIIGTRRERVKAKIRQKSCIGKTSRIAANIRAGRAVANCSIIAAR